jgi:hypothetical protein
MWQSSGAATSAPPRAASSSPLSCPLLLLLSSSLLAMDREEILHGRSTAQYREEDGRLLVGAAPRV